MILRGGCALTILVVATIAFLIDMAKGRTEDAPAFLVFIGINVVINLVIFALRKSAPD